MNFQQALLWTALAVMIGLFVFIFYEVIKNLREDKCERDQKNKNRNDRKSSPRPATKNIMAKVNQGGTNIVTQLSEISHSHVKVVNINNYSLGSEQPFMEDDCDAARGKSSFSESLYETKRESSVKKDGKGQARIYILTKSTEPMQKISTHTK